MRSTNRSWRRWVVAAVAIGLGVGATAGIAAAQSDPATTTAPAATAPADPAATTPPTGDATAPADRPDRPASTETALTGDVATKVTEAALAANPGATVERVETDDDGSPYEAHLTLADGSHVVVKVDESFAVTATETMEGRGPRGGGRGGPGAGETPLTGDTATQVTDAALAANPGATVERVETDSEGVYEAHLTLADGSHVIVQIDESFAVTGTQTMPAGRGPGGPAADAPSTTTN